MTITRRTEQPRSARPEVLAPAGNREMMRAAVENGADAIYFGLEDHNARLRGENFKAADLPEIMAWLHERGVRGYVTLNTLIFEEELEGVVNHLVACASAGVDAILVQDLGIAVLARNVAPELPVHASTQMTMTTSEGIAALADIGIEVDRIVAARELSRKELEKLQRGTEKEVEVFVHGAICVAYSGQCLTSEALGGRSANRGQCAQACRLPYDLIVDGVERDLGDVRYLLSPKDLAAYEDIGDLTRTGIVSFKIEGRYKSPEYVAATVKAYRRAIDSVMAGNDKVAMDAETRYAFEQTFSRGLTGGYIHDINHQVVVEGRFPKKRGAYLGKVVGVGREWVEVMLEAPLRPGDGVVFDQGRPDEDEQGGRVFTLFHGGQRIEGFEDTTPTLHRLTFPRGSVRTDLLREGDRVWKTSDPKLSAALRATYERESPGFHRPINARVEVKAGAPLVLEMEDEHGNAVRVVDSESAAEARNRPLTEDYLREQLGRLGNTPFVLESLDAQIEGDVMVPASRLNALRREAVEKLIALRRAMGTRREVRRDALVEMRNREPQYDRFVAPESGIELSVLCRTLQQVEAVAGRGDVRTIYTDFEDLRLHQAARELIPRGGPQRFVPATLRIMKPGEAPFLRKLFAADPDALLVRHLAGWKLAREEQPDLPLVADYSLNVANSLTARLLMGHGFAWLTPSYDLNFDQLAELLGGARADWFEVTLHQYMPMFHMEHCVFCRFMSDGTDFTNCGRPCESHAIALRDRVGRQHRVLADMGCRNTVFNGTAQSAAAYLDGLRGLGVRRFRIDLLDENADAVDGLVGAYLPALRGEKDGGDLWRSLKASSRLGVTRGSLDHD